MRKWGGRTKIVFPAAIGQLGFALAILLTPVPAPPQDHDVGRKIYEAQCGRCHGIRGGGGTGPALARPLLPRARDESELIAVILEGIPATGMPFALLSSDDSRQLAAYVLSMGRAATFTVTGNSVAGRLVYEAEDCSACHIVNGAGDGVGPELTNVGLRRGAEYIRTAIAHPGSQVPLDSGGFAEYLVVRAITAGGQQFVGRRINEDTFTIQLRTLENEVLSFRKRDLRELHRDESASLMPSFQGLLTPAEIEDLVAYLMSLTGTGP